MNGDQLGKVRTGDPLKIPAGAYNAFVDTAITHQSRERNTIADAHRELNQRGLVLVRNDSGIELPAHHAMAITGVLIEPDTNDDERTFQSRTPLKGNVADSASPPLAFVVAQQPIGPGKLGLCVISGTTPVQINVLDTGDSTCELRANETLLATSPLGGAPILWKEPGVGERWAVIELGRPSLGRITAILGPSQPIPTEANRWRYQWTEARLDGNPGSVTYLRYVPVFGGLASGTDPTRMAINRFEAHHCNDSVPGTGFEGLLGVGPVCDLPGVLHNCPPARSLEPRLAPVPEGVTVQLTCERDSLGNPVWIFEAMSCIEIADPADGDRKFNLLAAGGAG
jgi:hypothetical protein